MDHMGIRSKKGRKELKHAMTKADCYLLRHNLQPIMAKDDHTDEAGAYSIRSVYFDNIDNKVLTQKKEGNYERDKYRFRLYNLNSGYINLEKKSKRNTITYKEKCRVYAEEYERIRKGDISWMEHDQRDLIRELFMQMNLFQLKPISVVDYEREVFVYPYGNVRITFDSDIKTSNRNNDFLNPNLLMAPALNPDIVILEVKYDEFLPDIIKIMLQVSARRQDTYSKYLLSRVYG
ncbi:polyphosphate polymerase domain-containing protein [Bacillus sp. 1P06AnD]|uniref:polyphosphate polymerase domain-containing protein n=1 Tax=Bacillus sp. 1P06AnD TaxID=3132208 RepID=UPI0039A2BD87